MRTSWEVAASVRAKALNALGTLTGLQGNLSQAEALCQESLALFRELGDRQGIVTSLWMLGYVAMERSDYAVTRSLIQESLALSREVGDTWGIAYSLEVMAAVDLNQGHYATSRSQIEESLALSRRVEDTWGTARSLWLLAQILFSQSELAEAQPLLEEGLTLFKGVGDKRGIAYSLVILGYIAFFQGEHAKTQALLEESLALHREVGDWRGIAWGLYGLGWTALAQGDSIAARGLYEESLAILKKLDHRWFIALCLEGLAVAISMQGQPTWAARLWGAAESLRQAIGASAPPIVHAVYKQSLSQVRTQLGATAFTAAWNEGRTMALEACLSGAHRAVEEAASSKTIPAVLLPTYPAGLTAREVEVLRWVAQGLTDIQVAEKLIISRRTVSTHLNSIYNKLTVTTRSAATRFAVEHHLL